MSGRATCSWPVQPWSVETFDQWEAGIQPGRPITRPGNGELAKPYMSVVSSATVTHTLTQLTDVLKLLRLIHLIVCSEKRLSTMLYLFPPNITYKLHTNMRFMSLTTKKCLKQLLSSNCRNHSNQSTYHKVFNVLSFSRDLKQGGQSLILFQLSQGG